ncbi:MAG: radical SAM protein [Gammaproteobacteria bacterium]|nr:radical SAM protein [Gammaproteobacteria bacterium]
MSDIVLTHGYFLYEDEKELEIMKPYPTLGLLYLSAYLRRAGFDVEVFDTTFAARDELHARLHQGGGILGIYTNLMTRVSVVKIMGEAQALGWTVVVGGPESGNYPREYLEHGADVVVVGEGEATLEALIPRLACRGQYALDGIDGVVYRNDAGTIVTNAQRTRIPDIDSIPWPDREQIDISRYVDVWRQHHGMGSVNLITARGCPYRCKWCSHGVFGFSHRRRDFNDCVDEVEFIRDTYSPEQVWYADDVFTINHRWLASYAAELKRRRIQLPFETISRADRMMKEEVLETLAAIGCYRVWIGSESGSQRILDAMNRGVKVEQVEWAIKAAQRHGIEVGMFLMWGYDGETESDIEATIEHVKTTNPDIFFTTVTYPIKGTAYYDAVANKVACDLPWATSTDRDIKIKGRHSRTYYRHADKWLRNEVAAFRNQRSDPAGAQTLRNEALAARDAMRAVAAEVEA